MAGFGKSKNAKIGGRRRDFLEGFVKQVKLNRPVLISASMSGRFAMQYLLSPDASKCTQRLRGFVPIAPAGTLEFSADDYGSCKVSPAIDSGLFL